VQGLALVVIATVSTTLTSARGLGLSEASYGSLFIPQSILAVIGSLGGAALQQRIGARKTLLIGFAANAIAMSLIASSALLTEKPVAYVVLLCATSFLGVGFSIVTPTLNVLAAKLDAQHADRAGLIVNALLGGSAAIAPLLFLLFVSAGKWWGLPLLCAIGMLGLIVAALRIELNDGATSAASGARAALPSRVWLFAGFALAYGIAEQIDGSWAPLYMTHALGAVASFGSLALTFFWAVATAARVVFALATAKAKPTNVFRSLPFVLAGSFALLAFLPAHAPPLLGVAAFALAGLGISALLPLVLSLGERSMPEVAATAASVVFASYLVGYGIAAFGVGPLQERGITLSAIDISGLCVTLVVAALAAIIARTVGETP
jgi:predicted MFS family arabinose efflux permease